MFTTTIRNTLRRVDTKPAPRSLRLRAPRQTPTILTEWDSMTDAERLSLTLACRAAADHF